MENALDGSWIYEPGRHEPVHAALFSSESGWTPKRTQPAPEVGLFRFVFGGQHGFRWTQTLIIIYAIIHHHHTECILASSWMHPGCILANIMGDGMGYKESSVCQKPSRTLNTNPNAPFLGWLGSFLVFNSIHYKKSVAWTGSCRTGWYDSVLNTNYHAALFFVVNRVSPKRTQPAPKGELFRFFFGVQNGFW